MFTLKRWLIVSLMSILVLMLIGRVEQVQSQQKYPTRAIDILHPWATGGSVDLSCRIASVYLKKKWGVPLNVVNKPGGNTIPCTMELYKAALDGYTLQGDAVGSTSILVNTVQNLPFNVMDRTFIAMFAITPNVLIVPASSPFKTIEDVIADARKDPQNFTWSSAGGASAPDLAVRQFFKAIGVEFSKTKPVMTEGGAPQAALIAGGHAKLCIMSAAGVSPAVKGGMVRALAITSKNRDPEFPDVPTFSEAGYPTVNIQTWGGFTGPPKLPAYIVEIWDKAIQEMIKDPDVISKMRNNRSMPYYLNARDFKEHVMKETEEMGKLYGSK